MGYQIVLFTLLGGGACGVAGWGFVVALTRGGWRRPAGVVVGCVFPLIAFTIWGWAVFGGAWGYWEFWGPGGVFWRPDDFGAVGFPLALGALCGRFSAGEQQASERRGGDAPTASAATIRNHAGQAPRLSFTVAGRAAGGSRPLSGEATRAREAVAGREA